MSNKYNQELPEEIEKSLDGYLDRIKAIEWFKPKTLAKPTVDSAISASLKAFGAEATIEYRRLSTTEDWDAAWGAAWGAARDAARDAAWGAADLLAVFTPDGKYKEAYPNGNFLKLVDLWEMGLYPIGVIDGKFICYVPDVKETAALFTGKATEKK
jgi:hypothetical protein